MGRGFRLLLTGAAVNMTVTERVWAGYSFSGSHARADSRDTAAMSWVVDGIDGEMVTTKATWARARARSNVLYYFGHRLGGGVRA
jgi:hypothetical protein